MEKERSIILDRFIPRDYQLPIISAIEDYGYKDVMVLLPRRCLSGSSHILIADGSYKLLKDVKKGDRILSWNGSSHEEDTVKDVWSTGTKETITVTSSVYMPLTTSKDHVFAYGWSSTNAIQWNPIDKISPYAQLLQYGGTCLGTIHNPDLAEFYGYMLADGYVSGYQQPKFTNINVEILKRVEVLASTLFDIHVIWRVKGNGYDLGMSNKTRGGGSTKNPIKELFRKDGLDISKSKRRLPPLIWHLDEYSLGRYFAGLLSADGNIYCHKKGFTASDTSHDIPPAVEVSFHCGLSEMMAFDIYWLLRKMGIQPQYPRHDRGCNWKVRISRGVDIKKLLSYGRIYGKEEKQAEALKATANVTKKARLHHGCYKSKFKKSSSSPEELYDLETEKNHNFIANGYVVHNSGKDVVALNILIRAALTKVGIYYYVFPTFKQAKLAIWSSLTSDGNKFLDFIPKEVIFATHQQDMSITLINNSVIQLLGSSDYDRLRGTNASGVVYSEYAYQDPIAAQSISPSIAYNKGFSIYITTPKGKNFCYTQYQIALRNPKDWFTYLKTINETKHITQAQVDDEIRNGKISYDLAQQEYYCSFNRGCDGSFYSKYILQMQDDGRIGHVPYATSDPVHVAMDIGNDATSIIFFQVIGPCVNIIDCYENTGAQHGLEFYVNIIKNKPYVLGKCLFPHDMAVTEWGGSRDTRFEKARKLGLTGFIVDKKPVDDGIEAVKSLFSRMWIDENKCSGLLRSLENYQQEYDSKRETYTGRPLHNWASHYADSIRYLAAGMSKIGGTSSAEELNKRFQQAALGSGTNVFSPFNNGRQ